MSCHSSFYTVLYYTILYYTITVIIHYNYDREMGSAMRKRPAGRGAAGVGGPARPGPPEGARRRCRNDRGCGL